MKSFAILLATTALMSGSALAADPIVAVEPAPAPAPVETVATIAPAADWSGLYVGGQAGVAFNRDSGAFSSSNSSFVGGNDGGESGFVGGGHVGYDHQIGNFIVGGVADLNYIDAGSSTTYSLPTATGAQAFGAEQDINFVGTVRAKAGYAIDQFAVYGTGGVAFADIDNEYSGGNTYVDRAGTAFNVKGSTENDDVGYAVGGGVDYLATPNLSFGLEYLYTDLGDSSVKVNYANAAGLGGDFTTESNTDLDFHSVMAKASFRFN